MYDEMDYNNNTMMHNSMVDGTGFQTMYDEADFDTTMNYDDDDEADSERRTLWWRLYAFFQVLLIGYCVLALCKCFRQKIFNYLGVDDEEEEEELTEVDEERPDIRPISEEQRRRIKVRDCLEFRTVVAEPSKRGDLEEGKKASSPVVSSGPQKKKNRFAASLSLWIGRIRATTNRDATEKTSDNNSSSFSSIEDEEAAADPIPINVLLQSMNANGNSNSKKRRSRKQQQKQQHDRDCSCIICLEPYRVGDTVARMKPPPKASPEDTNASSCCNHWFHEDCIMAWLQNHDQCPLCRVQIVGS